MGLAVFFFFSSRRRHTRLQGDWSSDVCSSDLVARLPRHRDPHGVSLLTDVNLRALEREQHFVVDLVSEPRSEERRVGKSVDLGGRRIIKKKKYSEVTAGAVLRGMPT